MAKKPQSKEMNKAKAKPSGAPYKKNAQDGKPQRGKNKRSEEGRFDNKHGDGGNKKFAGNKERKSTKTRKAFEEIKAVRGGKAAPAAIEAASNKSERIAKVMARAGLCSRRDAERWIADGRVSVNGTILDSPAIIVTGKDEIIVDGKPLPQKEETRLFLYHKAAGLVTTARDEKGRATVFDKLPPELPRVISVGRLDLNTEGLLLLTNDGELARYLELPATGWRRRYRVRAYGSINQERLDKLKNGLTVEGIKYGPIEAVLEKQQGGNCWMNVTLKEGKNREIRNVMEALGLKVNRLLRLSYGPFHLGSLPRGGVAEVTGKVLREQASGFFRQGATKG